MRHPLLAACVLTATVADLAAQRTSTDPNHVLVLADSASTVRRALDEATSKNLHVLFGNNQGLYFSRLMGQDPVAGYRHVAEGRPDNFEKAINADAGQGFRLIQETLTRSGNNTAAVMGRVSSGSTPYRYRVLAADERLAKNLNDLGSKGFAPVGVFTQPSYMSAALGRPGRLHVVLEASGGAATPTMSAPETRYQVLSTLLASTLEKELNVAAAEGYRVYGGSSMNVLLVKDDSAVRYSYRAIGVSRESTLQRELEQVSRAGYRLVTTAIMDNPNSKSEIVLLAERPAVSTRAYKYVMVDKDWRVGAIDVLRANGFAAAALVFHWDYFLLFEKGL